MGLFSSIESERIVWGALISQPEFQARFADEIGAGEVFSTAEGKAIFGALCAVNDAGHPMHVEAVVRYLDEAKLAEVVENGSLGVFAHADARHSASVVEYHIEQLRDARVKRELHTALAQLGNNVESFMDPRDTIAAAQAALGRVEKLMSQGGRLPAMRDALTLLDFPPETPCELVAGILHRGSKLVLGGASKSNKTWCLLDLAISVAAGADWWGHPTEQGRVLFLNMEVQEPFFAQRLKAVCRAKRVSLKPFALMARTLRGHCAPIESLSAEIIRAAKGQDFALIVVDPIYKMLQGRDENAAGDIGAAMNELEKIAVETGAAVAFGAHFAKGNASAKDSIDRISGSGVFARDPDSILTLTAHEEAGGFVVEPVLRNHPPIEPFTLRWAYPLMELDGALDPARLKKPKTGREPAYSDDDALKVLKASGELNTTEWQKKCEEENGMSRRQFFTIRKRLESAKRISKSKLEDTWLPR